MVLEEAINILILRSVVFPSFPFRRCLVFMHRTRNLRSSKVIFPEALVLAIRLSDRDFS